MEFIIESDLSKPHQAKKPEPRACRVQRLDPMVGVKRVKEQRSCARVVAWRAKSEKEHQTSPDERCCNTVCNLRPWLENQRVVHLVEEALREEQAVVEQHQGECVSGLRVICALELVHTD